MPRAGEVERAVRRAVLAALLVGTLFATAAGQTAPSAADSALAVEILEELVEIRTLSGSPATVEAAEALAARLRAAGFSAEDVQVTGPEPGLGNLVARYRGDGTGGAPILLMAHLDVVDARPEDWSVDPFTLTEEEGWWYGRGTTDNKAGAAMLVANFIRYRQQEFVPDRDLIIVLTADEETTSASIKWLVGEGREHIDDPAFALNTDSGGGILRDSEEAMFGVQASEKIYLTFQLEVTNPGGHSSRPTPDNAIYRLAGGLNRIAAHRFPVELNDVMRAFFERSAALEEGQLAADMRAVAATPPDPAAAERLSESPYYNALMRTTCVATRLEAGHADNALPQTARATVNCRVLPGGSPDEIERIVAEVLADDEIAISRVNVPTASPPSPLTPDVLGPIEELAGAMWPGVPVVPLMSTGATDGLYVRNAGIPVYGVSAIFSDPDDARAHGKDERIAIDRFYEALEYWYRLVRNLSR
ncbi:MAG TPA: M20/M25/M40 family metallo-hydrolase [Gemmatimonadota bacterium]|nr:M20/M25/M40 family metallo-hydrolase [Gemmatimonadota bacterium]